MYFDGALREIESPSNRRVAQAFGQQDQYFSLARRERVSGRNSAPYAAERLADHVRIGTRAQALCNGERNVEVGSRGLMISHPLASQKT